MNKSIKNQSAKVTTRVAKGIPTDVGRSTSQGVTYEASMGSSWSGEDNVFDSAAWKDMLKITKKTVKAKYDGEYNKIMGDAKRKTNALVNKHTQLKKKHEEELSTLHTNLRTEIIQADEEIERLYKMLEDLEGEGQALVAEFIELVENGMTERELTHGDCIDAVAKVLEDEIFAIHIDTSKLVAARLAAEYNGVGRSGSKSGSEMGEDKKGDDELVDDVDDEDMS